MQHQGGRISEVRCRPDISVDTLATLIKEKFKPKLDKWATVDMTLKFNGTILEPDEPVTGINTDLQDANGKRVVVQVETPK